MDGRRVDGGVGERVGWVKRGTRCHVSESTTTTTESGTFRRITCILPGPHVRQARTASSYAVKGNIGQASETSLDRMGGNA